MTFSVSQEWNPRQKLLTELLRKKESFSSARELCLQLHAQLHDFSPEATIFSRLKDLVSSAQVNDRVSTRGMVAWNLVHITRIEDAVVQILIADQAQLFTSQVQRDLGLSFTDTGNALTPGEMDGVDLCWSAFWEYRRAVGRATQKVLGNLGSDELRRKPSSRSLERLFQEGVLVANPQSSWLGDFWARKTVSGLLTMPLTRHQVVHINDCFKRLGDVHAPGAGA